MRIFTGSLVLATVFILQACSEGGIGGTGSVTDPSSPVSLVDVSGQGNKGPFNEGAQVSARSTADGATHSAMTAGVLGDFTVSMERDRVGQIDITGRFFSENRGVMSDEQITLSGIAVGDPDERANVNVGTHLIHERVLELIDSGMSFDEAMSSAHTEMTLAMSDVVPSPANPMRFNELVVINAAQTEGNPEGNAWLLACTSVLEGVALARSETNGTSMEAELQSLMDEMATAFSENGTLPQALIDEMLAVRATLNPDRIHDRLLHWQDELTEDALMSRFGMSRMDAQAMECTTSGSDIECWSGGGMHGGGNMHRMDMENLVANMNRFMDTDGDGIVNHDDDDDDNDGIPDTDDDTPYGGSN